MPEIYGLPQILTGNETVTIHQVQNGQIALCTMPLSSLAALLGSGSSTTWAADLPKVMPTTSGVVWNNNGVVSIS